ncbi:MAG: hypothetical protein IJ630_10855, partial [Treponema sp.]|nr:hypothetical protein [Treponema sp.]
CTLIENAEVTISKSEKGTKNISPADGTKVQSFIDRSYSVSFSPDDDYEFIRWELYDINTGEEITNGTYVTLEDPAQPSTNYSVTQVPDTGIELALRPVVAKRPQFISWEPMGSGQLKDSTIQVLFNKDMDSLSIYYTEKEMDSIRDRDSSVTPLFENGRVDGEGNQLYYGYVQGGQTYFKNIMITNMKTEANITGCFNAPVFESARILSIPASKEEGHIIDNYTQVLVTIEKDFFYSEPIDDGTSKAITLSQSKIWMYQVNSETDTQPLVIASSGGNDVFTAEVADSMKLTKEESHSVSSDGSGIETLKFMEDGKLNLDFQVLEQNNGSGPSSFFSIYLKKLYGENYSALAEKEQTEQKVDIYYQNVTADEGEFKDIIDFNDENVTLDDGLYSMYFEFKDRSGNSLIYPADGKFYFAVDTKAPEMTLPIVKSEDSSTYTFECNDCIDVKSAQIVYTKGGSEMTPVTMNKDSSDNRYRGEISSIAEDTAYGIKIRYTDYAGHTSEKEVPKFLTGFTLTGSPDFTGANASHIENLFFAGDKIADYGITAKKYYSDGSSVDVSSNSTIPSRSSYNSSWDFTYTYSEGSVSKSPVLGGTYYIAKKDALTQEPVKLTDYVGTCGGGSYYKFGDFPQTISGISSYSSSPVCNGWYLGSDGYFYEKCTANPYMESGSNYTCSDGTKLAKDETYYFRVEPIRWRKLTDSYDGKSLLFAEDELTAGIPYYLNSSNRTIGSSTVYPNNYKYSTLRAFLNGKYEDDDPQERTYSGNGFLQKAFTSFAQNLIANTEVDNSARGTNPDTNMIWNNGNNQYACANTTDKIFLLSQQELTKSDYGFQVYNSPSVSDYSSGANSRTRFTTDYAKANYALQDVRDGIGGWWWMRSPRFYASTEARIVIRNGCTDNNFRCVYNSNEGGIVPALCVSASDLP